MPYESLQSHLSGEREEKKKKESEEEKQQVKRNGSSKTENSKRNIWEPDTLSGERNVLVSICVGSLVRIWEKSCRWSHTAQDGNVEMRKIYDDALNMS